MAPWYPGPQKHGTGGALSVIIEPTFELKNVSTSQPANLYFGSSASAGHEGQWIKTVPGKGWFAYIRIYGPDKAPFDGSSKPDDFEVVK